MPLRDELLAVNEEDLDVAIEAVFKPAGSISAATKLAKASGGRYAVLVSIGQRIANSRAGEKEGATPEEKATMRLKWRLGLTVLKEYSEQPRKPNGSQLMDELLAISQEQAVAAIGSVSSRRDNPDEWLELTDVMEKNYAALYQLGTKIGEMAVRNAHVLPGIENSMEDSWHFGLAVLKECGEQQLVNPADLPD